MWQSLTRPHSSETCVLGDGRRTGAACFMLGIDVTRAGRGGGGQTCTMIRLTGSHCLESCSHDRSAPICASR